jgi:hypothetical protein
MNNKSKNEGIRVIADFKDRAIPLSGPDPEPSSSRPATRSANQEIILLADFRDQAQPLGGQDAFEVPVKSSDVARPNGHTSDYRVVRGGRLLGTIKNTGFDMPWFEGVFEPTAAFGEVQALFDQERQLLDADRIAEWGAVWGEIMGPGMRLEPLDGSEPIAEFLLHIDGQKARWRY